MTTEILGYSGERADVDAGTRALRATLRPLGYDTLGHYRTTHRCVLAATQAANSRLFEVRNAGTNLIVPTRLCLRAIQTAAGTAQENSIDVYRATSFTAVDTTNTATPTATVARTSGMTAAPGGAALRGVTSTGVAAGMTGGTLTKDGNAIAQLPILVAAAASVTTSLLDAFDFVPGLEHPLILAADQGLTVENRVLNVTSYGFSLYIDFAWAEVRAF